MKLSLLVMTAGKAGGQVIPVTLAQFIIGRDPQCQLRPASALISKRHCALLVRNGQVFLRDFDSTNGTFLNGEPVKGEVRIKNEDVLRVGPLEFKVAIEATKVAPNKPTPAPAAKPAAAKQSAAMTKASAAASADDDIAAMLLSLPGEENTDPSKPVDEQGIPSGSTVMDMIVPKEALAPTDQPAQDAAPAPEKGLTPQPANKSAEKKEDKKVDPAHVAAKAILDKYARRGRG